MKTSFKNSFVHCIDKTVLFLDIINHKSIKMKKYLIIAVAMTTLISCNSNADMSLFKENKKIAQKYIASYESPSDYELFKTMTDENIEHQSPMYGDGIVGYEKVLEQGNFYMSNFSDVSFENSRWLPGVNEETLQADGSVRVYGTWKGVSNASGKSFSVDGYHYFVINEGKIVQSGDFFDATGMVMSVQPDSLVDVAVIIPLTKGYATWHKGFIKDNKTRERFCDDSRTLVLRDVKDPNKVSVYLYDVDMSKLGEMMQDPAFEKLALSLGEDLANKKVYTLSAL